eukprot:3146555-Amphidinium_carterae.2
MLMTRPPLDRTQEARLFDVTLHTSSRLQESTAHCLKVQAGPLLAKNLNATRSLGEQMLTNPATAVSYETRLDLWWLVDYNHRKGCNAGLSAAAARNKTSRNALHLRKLSAAKG